MAKLADPAVAALRGGLPFEPEDRRSCLGGRFQHHEYFDGSGYPEALSGKQIPLGARIIAVADAYDTITSDRTYKKARTAEDALAELERCANAQFDGIIVELFVRTMRQQPNPVIEVASLARSS